MDETALGPIRATAVERNYPRAYLRVRCRMRPSGPIRTTPVKRNCPRADIIDLGRTKPPQRRSRRPLSNQAAHGPIRASPVECRTKLPQGRHQRLQSNDVAPAPIRATSDARSRPGAYPSDPCRMKLPKVGPNDPCRTQLQSPPKTFQTEHLFPKELPCLIYQPED